MPKPRRNRKAEERLIERSGQVIERCRISAELSRSEVARRLGQPTSYLTRCVKGRNVTLRTLARVLDVMGAEVTLGFRER